MLCRSRVNLKGVSLLLLLGLYAHLATSTHVDGNSTLLTSELSYPQASYAPTLTTFEPGELRLPFSRSISVSSVARPLPRPANPVAPSTFIPLPPSSPTLHFHSPSHTASRQSATFRGQTLCAETSPKCNEPQWRAYAGRQGAAVEFSGQSGKCTICSCAPGAAASGDCRPIGSVRRSEPLSPFARGRVDAAVSVAPRESVPTATSSSVSTRRGGSTLQTPVDDGGVPVDDSGMANTEPPVEDVPPTRLVVSASCGGSVPSNVCCEDAMQALVCSGVFLSACSCRGSNVPCAQRCNVGPSAAPVRFPPFAPRSPARSPADETFLESIKLDDSRAWILIALLVLLFACCCLLLAVGVVLWTWKRTLREQTKIRNQRRVAVTQSRFRSADRVIARRIANAQRREVAAATALQATNRAPSPPRDVEGRPVSMFADQQLAFDRDGDFFEIHRRRLGKGILDLEPSLFRQKMEAGANSLQSN